MPDDTTEAREVLAGVLRDAGLRTSAASVEDGATTCLVHIGPALAAMLAYAATARQSAIEDAARVAQEGAVCGCGRSDCAIDGKALSIADAIRQLGSSGEEAK